MGYRVRFDKGYEFATLADSDFYNTGEDSSGILPTSLEFVDRKDGNGKSVQLSQVDAFSRTKGSRLSTMLIAIINGLIERLYFYGRPSKNVKAFIDAGDRRLDLSTLTEEQLVDAFSYLPRFIENDQNLFYWLLNFCKPQASAARHIMGDETRAQERGYSFYWNFLASCGFEYLRESTPLDLSIKFYETDHAARPVLVILPPSTPLGSARNTTFSAAINIYYFNSIYFDKFSISDLAGGTDALWRELGKLYGQTMPICQSVQTDFASAVAEACPNVISSADTIRGYVQQFEKTDGGNNTFWEGAMANRSGEAEGFPSASKIWMVRNLAVTSDAPESLKSVHEFLDQALYWGQRALGKGVDAYAWTPTSGVEDKPISLALSLAIMFQGDNASVLCHRMQPFTLAANAVAISRYARDLVFYLPGVFDDTQGNEEVKRFKASANCYQKEVKYKISFQPTSSLDMIKRAMIDGVSEEMFDLVAEKDDTAPDATEATENNLGWKYSEDYKTISGNYNFTGSFRVSLNAAAYVAQNEYYSGEQAPEHVFTRSEPFTVDLPGNAWNGIQVVSYSIPMSQVLKTPSLFTVEECLHGYNVGQDAMMKVSIDAKFPVVDGGKFEVKSDGVEMLPLASPCEDSRAPVYGDCGLFLPAELAFAEDGIGSITVFLADTIDGGIEYIASDSGFRNLVTTMVSFLKQHCEQPGFEQIEGFLNADKKTDNVVHCEADVAIRMGQIYDSFNGAEGIFGRDNLMSVKRGEEGVQFDPVAVNGDTLGVFIVQEDFEATGIGSFKKGDILTCVVSQDAALGSGCFLIDYAAETCELLGSALPGEYYVNVNFSGESSFIKKQSDVIGRKNANWTAQLNFSNVIGKSITRWKNLEIVES